MKKQLLGLLVLAFAGSASAMNRTVQERADVPCIVLNDCEEFFGAVETTCYVLQDNAAFIANCGTKAPSCFSLFFRDGKLCTSDENRDESTVLQFGCLGGALHVRHLPESCRAVAVVDEVDLAIAVFNTSLVVTWRVSTGEEVDRFMLEDRIDFPAGVSAINWVEISPSGQKVAFKIHAQEDGNDDCVYVCGLGKDAAEGVFVGRGIPKCFSVSEEQILLESVSPNRCDDMDTHFAVVAVNTGERTYVSSSRRMMGALQRGVSQRISGIRNAQFVNLVQKDALALQETLFCHFNCYGRDTSFAVPACGVDALLAMGVNMDDLGEQQFGHQVTFYVNHHRAGLFKRDCKLYFDHLVQQQAQQAVAVWERPVFPYINFMYRGKLQRAYRKGFVPGYYSGTDNEPVIIGGELEGNVGGDDSEEEEEWSDESEEDGE